MLVQNDTLRQGRLCSLFKIGKVINNKSSHSHFNTFRGFTTAVLGCFPITHLLYSPFNVHHLFECLTSEWMEWKKSKCCYQYNTLPFTHAKIRTILHLSMTTQRLWPQQWVELHLLWTTMKKKKTKKKHKPHKLNKWFIVQKKNDSK